MWNCFELWKIFLESIFLFLHLLLHFTVSFSKTMTSWIIRVNREIYTLNYISHFFLFYAKWEEKWEKKNFFPLLANRFPLCSLLVEVLSRREKVSIWVIISNISWRSFQSEGILSVSLNHFDLVSLGEELFQCFQLNFSRLAWIFLLIIGDDYGKIERRCCREIEYKIILDISQWWEKKTCCWTMIVFSNFIMIRFVTRHLTL